MSMSFDLIYLYSVFSHLPEEMHWNLLKEFHRLLAPGGMLIATTWRRDFILECEAMRQGPIPEKAPLWFSNIATRFPDTIASLAAYDRGEFCHSKYESDSLERGFWGETCIPRTYVEKRWTELFDVVEYIDEPALCPQNTIIVRKSPRH